MMSPFLSPDRFFRPLSLSTSGNGFRFHPLWLRFPGGLRRRSELGSGGRSDSMKIASSNTVFIGYSYFRSLRRASGETSESNFS